MNKFIFLNQSAFYDMEKFSFFMVLFHDPRSKLTEKSISNYAQITLLLSKTLFLTLTFFKSNL